MEKRVLGEGLLGPNGKPIHQELEKSHSEIPLAYVDGNTFGVWKNSSMGSPYKSNGTVRRAIDIMSYNLAQLPFLVFKNGEKLENVIDPNNVMIGSLLKSPNEITSGFKFKLTHWSYFLLYDKVYWMLNRNPFGIIKEFYVLNPRMVQEKCDNNGVIQYYTYNNKIRIEPEDMVEFSGFNPGSVSGTGGSSILDTLKTELDTEKNAAQYGNKFFENGSRVAGVISVDKDVPVTIEEMEKVLGMWMAAHQGSSNAYKVGALLNGMKYEERGMTMKDAEFIEGRKEIKERIIEAYGIPKSVYGLVDKIDRATADTQMRQFWQVTLKPLAIMLQEDINTLLVRKNFPGYEVRCDFAVVEELKKDVNETADAALKYFGLGYTRNEVNKRFKLDMPEESSGDERFITVQVQPPQNAEPLAVGDSAKAQDVDLEDLINKGLHDKAVDKYRERFLAEQKDQEKSFYSKLKRYLFEYRKEVISLVNGEKSLLEFLVLLNALNELKSKQDAKLIEMLGPLYFQASLAAIEGADDLIEGTGEVVANSKLVDVALENITGINDTIQKQLRKELKAGIDAGETVAQLTDRVRGVYNFSTTKARQIALTETNNIMNASAFAHYKDNGIKYKRWLTAGDSRVRDSHRANEAQGVIPIDQPFSSGEKFPSSVNCRCAIAAEFKL